MKTLNEFLLARIAEDEDFANAVGDYRGPRLLAEVQAKRRIGEEHRQSYRGSDSCNACAGDGEWFELGFADWPCTTIRALATVYSDHPDYDPSWRV